MGSLHCQFVMARDEMILAAIDCRRKLNIAGAFDGDQTAIEEGTAAGRELNAALTRKMHGKSPASYHP